VFFVWFLWFFVCVGLSFGGCMFGWFDFLLWCGVCEVLWLCFGGCVCVF
jgi:hypothetical protein